MVCFYQSKDASYLELELYYGDPAMNTMLNHEVDHEEEVYTTEFNSVEPAPVEPVPAEPAPMLPDVIGTAGPDDITSGEEEEIDVETVPCFGLPQFGLAPEKLNIFVGSPNEPLIIYNDASAVPEEPVPPEGAGECISRWDPQRGGGPPGPQTSSRVLPVKQYESGLKESHVNQLDPGLRAVEQVVERIHWAYKAKRTPIARWVDDLLDTDDETDLPTMNHGNKMALACEGAHVDVTTVNDKDEAFVSEEEYARIASRQEMDHASDDDEDEEGGTSWTEEADVNVTLAPGDEAEYYKRLTAALDDERKRKQEAIENIHHTMECMIIAAEIGEGPLGFNVDFRQRPEKPRPYVGNKRGPKTKIRRAGEKGPSAEGCKRGRKPKKELEMKNGPDAKKRRGTQK